MYTEGMDVMEHTLATLKEVAGIYRYDVTYLRLKAGKGELPGAFKLGTGPRKQWRVDLSELRKAWGK